MHRETLREDVGDSYKEWETRGGFMTGRRSQCLKGAEWPTTDWRTENTNKEPCLRRGWMGSIQDTWLDFIWLWLWPEPLHISVLWRDSTAKTAANRVVRTLSTHTGGRRRSTWREEDAGETKKSEHKKWKLSEINSFYTFFFCCFWITFKHIQHAGSRTNIQNHTVVFYNLFFAAPKAHQVRLKYLRMVICISFP